MIDELFKFVLTYTVVSIIGTVVVAILAWVFVSFMFREPKPRRCKDCRWYKKNKAFGFMWCSKDKSWAITSKTCGDDYKRKWFK